MTSDYLDKSLEKTLLTHKCESPPCEAKDCRFSWPRTAFDGEQFKCLCGWRTNYSKEFIEKWKK